MKRCISIEPPLYGNYDTGDKRARGVATSACLTKLERHTAGVILEHECVGIRRKAVYLWRASRIALIIATACTACAIALLILVENTRLLSHFLVQRTNQGALLAYLQINDTFFEFYAVSPLPPSSLLSKFAHTPRTPRVHMRELPIKLLVFDDEALVVALAGHRGALDLLER